MTRILSNPPFRAQEEANNIMFAKIKIMLIHNNFIFFAIIIIFFLMKDKIWK